MRTAAVIASLVVVVCNLGSVAAADGATSGRPARADEVLDASIRRFVTGAGRAPGIAVVVQRGRHAVFHAAGVANVVTGASPKIDDSMRLASVAKAFSGAAAKALVRSGALSLRDTVGQRLPRLPRAWARVTLAQLLGHTSGIPDFSKSEAFRDALVASLDRPPRPSQLLAFVESSGLNFTPGSRYEYSNSDNIVVGLMIQAATGRRYEAVLEEKVYRPFHLLHTNLPRGATIRGPLIHGYTVSSNEAREDVTGLFAAGWTWASGGIVSTPADANRFIRRYVKASARGQQFRFVRGGSSEPPGPGTNAAGLALFRYETRCGTVYGHTGNTAGYTQFVAATRDGSRSATVSINAQITPSSDPAHFPALRRIFQLAVCAALAHS